MDNFDVAGVLTTYAEKAQKTNSTDKLKEVIRDLKSELDLRKIKVGNNNG